MSREQHRTDPARAKRDQDVVHQSGQLGSPPAVSLPDAGDDAGSLLPVFERGSDYPLGGDHGADEVAHETARATIAGIDTELVGDDRGEIRSREEREEGLAEPGLLLA